MVLQSSGKNLTFSLDKIKVQLASYKAFKLGARVILNQGGTRSAKTYGVVKLQIGIAFKGPYQISITSLSLPHLRKGAMKDWKEIMNNYDLYDVKNHRRTDRAYDYPTGSYIEFFSVDDSLKVRGPGRDILFVNELNLIDFETFIQLLLRTKKCVFGDYNPADEFHWIYDELLAEFVYQDGDIAWYRRKGKPSTEPPDVAFIKSTYLDNPFLPHEQVKEIENLKNVDENFWRIYGEGERGHSEGVIYTHWSPYSGTVDGNMVFGLDFGYNNPTALTRVTEKDQNLYWKEEFYQSNVTNSDLIPVLKQICKPTDPIYCDAAEPARIEEIRRAGLKAIPANKNVKDGIDFVKSRKLFIHSGSANLLKEIKSYKFKNRGKKVGNEPEEPLKLNDHACFTAETLVITDRGLIRLGEIETGSHVLTSEGFKMVLFRFNNGLKQTKKYSLLFDTFSVTLECTPEHLIKTESGWIQISRLRLGMMVSLFNFSEEESILSIPENDILKVTNTACIGMYGSTTTVKDQKDSMYITLMKTHGTIGSLIWNCANLIGTSQNMERQDIKTTLNGQKSFTQKALKLLKNGIRVLMGLIGIDSTQLIADSEISHTGKEGVNCAVISSKQKQLPTSSVTQTAKLRRFVEEEGIYQVVFDLAVEDCHEYFANGVLVHNCDAGRYASISLKKPKVSYYKPTFHKV